MTFTGTVTAVNTALAGLGFTPTAAGPASLQIMTNDQGNTGGGALSRHRHHRHHRRLRVLSQVAQRFNRDSRSIWKLAPLWPTQRLQSGDRPAPVIRRRGRRYQAPSFICGLQQAPGEPFQPKRQLRVLNGLLGIGSPCPSAPLPGLSCHYRYLFGAQSVATLQLITPTEIPH